MFLNSLKKRLKEKKTRDEIYEVMRNPLLLKGPNNYSEEFLIELLDHWDRAIEYMVDPSEKICLAAVKKDGELLRFIKNQTEEVCLKAIRKCGIHGGVLQYVNNQTENIIMEALEEDPSSLRYVREMKPKYQKHALAGDPFVFHLIENPSLDLCFEVISTNPNVISTIKNPTLDMIILAIKEGCDLKNIKRWQLVDHLEKAKAAIRIPRVVALLEDRHFWVEASDLNMFKLKVFNGWKVSDPKLIINGKEVEENRTLNEGEIIKVIGKSKTSERDF